VGTENQQPSAGLAELDAKYGGATLSGGAYRDPDDFDVIVGREQRRPVGSEFTMQEQAEFLYGGVPSDYTREFPTVKKSSEVEKQLYSPDTDVAELQRRLWAGGFYPPGTDPAEIALGDRDPYTDKAWQNAIERAGKFKAAGQKKTLDEVIDEAIGLRKGSGADTTGTGRQPLVVELVNPEDLKYYAQRTAVATLGRALRPDEINRFVSSFHASQQASQTQAYNQRGAAGGQTVSAPSPAVAAEQFARQTDPTAAGAHDVVRVFDVVSKVLGGRRARG